MTYLFDDAYTKSRSIAGLGTPKRKPPPVYPRAGGGGGLFMFGRGGGCLRIAAVFSAFLNLGTVSFIGSLTHPPSPGSRSKDPAKAIGFTLAMWLVVLWPLVGGRVNGFAPCS
jgi:hypothetical protein